MIFLSTSADVDCVITLGPLFNEFPNIDSNTVMDNRKGKGSRQVIPSISSKKTTVVVAASQDLKIGTKRPAEDYEWTSRIKREDKESGNYQRYTTKEKASSG
ncbi:hypothetical protein Vadar_011253 [Vaccinium darrowii]|uniref:Uncharacterized protein n=1 Tax=Vaccinium darrowii TaxID=229202 RepID=A0ACB7YM36_9ERIC|nr:hypothetical protein Vadar_011253 [Vaccinium darrowii]